MGHWGVVTDPPPSLQKSVKAVPRVIGPLLGLPWWVFVFVAPAVVGLIMASVFRIKRDRTFEVSGNLVRIYQGEISYFNRGMVEEGVGHFLSAGATPSRAPTATGYPSHPAAWTSDPRWNALGFAIDGPHRYQYRVTTSGSGLSAGFTVTAIGDVDGDGVFSTFSRSARRSGGEIVGSPIEVTNELE